MLFNLLTDSPSYLYDVIEPFAIYLGVAIVGLLLLGLAIVLLTKKPNGTKVAKALTLSLIAFLLVFGIFMLVLEICKKYSSSYLDKNWVNKDVLSLVLIPLLITTVLALLGLIMLLILNKKGCACKKTAGTVFGVVLTCCIVTCLILIYIYYTKHIVDNDYYNGKEAKFNSLALYLGSALLVALVVTVSFIVGRTNKAPFDTHCIAFAGITLALSFGLSYVKFEGAWLQGGSITLFSLLPVCLFAFIYGMKKGLLVGVIYGLLQAVQDPYIIHPAQFLLDFPVAFGMICFAGLFTDLNLLKSHDNLRFGLGALLVGLFRYVSHVLSGVFAFGAYALDAGNANFLAYSSVYNSYVLIDIALVIVVGMVLLSSNPLKKELLRLKSN